MATGVPSPGPLTPHDGSQVWIGTEDKGGTEGSAPTRCFSFGDMCPGFSGAVPVSYNLIIFNEGNLLDIYFQFGIYSHCTYN